MDTNRLRVPSQFAAPDQAEGVFSGIVDESKVGLVVYQVDDATDAGSLRLVYANPASVGVTGAPLAEIIGHPLRVAFPWLAETELPAVYLEVALGGEGRDIEDSPRSAVTTAESFSTRAFGLPEKCVGISYTSVVSLQAAQQRVVDVMEAMSDAFVTLDLEWRIVYMNPQAAVLLERGLGDLAEKCLWTEFPELVGTRFHHVCQEAFDAKSVMEFEDLYAPLDRYLSVRVCPTASGIGLYLRDITDERRRNELRLHDENLAAIGKVCAGIAHDFNNFITSIRGFAEIGKRSRDPAETAKCFEEIELAGGKASALTSSLLAFGRDQEVSPLPVDLNALVREILPMAQQLVARGVEVRFESPPEPVTGFFDPRQIERVLLDLLSNGSDAIDGPGTITIRTCLTAPQGIVHDRDPSRRWLQVVDSGSGIPAAVMPHIFDPFFTTKQTGEGTGLGLSTISGIVSQSGGEIFVESEAGLGTTVTIALPGADPTASGPDPLSVGAGAPAAGGAAS